MRPGGIDAWVARQRLTVVFRGAYAIGHEPLNRRGRLMAAVLASGPAAVLSHRSAGWLRNVLKDNRPAIDVTVPSRRRGQAGIVVHESWLDEPDRAVVDGIPVTSLARTLLDLAEVVPRWRLDRAIEEAEHSGTLDLRAIDAVVARANGRHGLGRLTAALAAYRPLPFTRSELERRFTELIRAAGLPPPSQNVYLHGFEVDAVWHDRRLIVELDGYESHRTRQAFERDRERDACLAEHGWRVLRFTWLQVVHEPETVVGALRRTLTQP